MTAYSATRTVTAVVKKGDWNDAAWAAANKVSGNATTTLTVNVRPTGGSGTGGGFGGGSGGGGGTGGGGAGPGRHALGGIFSNGIWSAISQFANGGIFGKHGSLFLAGEAGPEIVGHVGGRTEILNQSQLASAMYSAVHSAMNGVSLDATFYNDSGEQNYEAMYNAVYDAMAAALAKSEALDRDRNNILRQINEKEFSADVSTSAINRANSRMNRRAGITVAPVGAM